MKEFPFTPRDYQTSTRYKTNAVLNKGGNPLIVLDTGLGKTKTDYMIIVDRLKLGKRIYIITPNKEVFSQWLKELSEYGINPGYCNSDGFRGRDRSVYVCMMQSLFNNISIIPESLYPDELHIDEAHHSPCGTIETICTFFGKAQRLGMTATPLRTDNKPLGDLFTEIINEIDIKTAIDRGFATEPFLITPDQYIDKIPMNGTDFDVKVQFELLGKTEIIGDVIETYSNVLCGLPCLVACSTSEHAKLMVNKFNEAGWIAEHIHSKLPDHERKAMTNRISKGKTNILCTVGVGIEGWDCPSLFGLIWLRRTMSVTIWKQLNGRVLRLMEGKDHAIIIDPVGNTVIHGMPDHVRVWDLKEGEIVEDGDSIAWQRCPDCKTYNSIMNTECHFCGADLTEEGRKEGTCRRCKRWKEGGCSEGLDFTWWILNEGCLCFQKKGRSMPAMIDGKLVAITTDGQIQELRARSDKTKEDIKRVNENEENERLTAEPISSVEKRQIIQRSLFSDQGRRSLFKEALEG